MDGLGSLYKLQRRCGGDKRPRAFHEVAPCPHLPMKPTYSLFLNIFSLREASTYLRSDPVRFVIGSIILHFQKLGSFLAMASGWLISIHLTPLPANSRKRRRPVRNFDKSGDFTSSISKNAFLGYKAPLSTHTIALKGLIMKLNVILAVMVLFGAQFGWAGTLESTDTLSTRVKTQPKTGISVEPLWFLLGGVGAKFEYFATDRISLGISGIYIPEHEVKPASSKDESTTSLPTYRFSSNEINLGSNFMLTGTLSSNGVYINPAIGYQNTRISDYGTFKLKGALSSPQGRLTLGYQWVNELNNLRFALGGGMRIIKSSDIIVKNEAGSEVYRENSSNLGGLALDAHLGYIF